MQRAVREGFNPFNRPGIDMSRVLNLQRAFGLSDDQVFQNWRKLVMKDTTDWGLCHKCATAFQRATQQKAPPTTKPIAERRDYGAVFQVALQATNSPVGALMKFEEKVASDPESVDKLFWHGCAYLTAAIRDSLYLDRAIELFERALELDPKNTQVYSNLFSAYLNKKDTSGQRRTLMRWAKVDPGLPQEIRKQLEVLETETAVPRTVTETVSKGKALKGDGKLDEAIEMLEKAINVYENNLELNELLSDALNTRAAALIKMGQDEAGFRDILRATQVSPENWYAQHNLCTTAENRGDFDLALQAGRKALALNPELGSNAAFMARLEDLKRHRSGGAKGARDATPHPAGAVASAPRKKWWRLWK
jgi:tetratricopeptide (TPR) repeat protein